MTPPTHTHAMQFGRSGPLPDLPAGDESEAEAPAEVPETPAVPLPRLSFESFYDADRARLGRAVAFALGDADLAAEAVDEAFTRAYERWGSISQQNPPAWVYRVAMNWALSVLRRRRRSQHRLYLPEAADHPIADPAVHAALAELDPKHRSVVVCRHLLGWSVAETAAALQLREGTVKSRLSRATAILQARLHHLRPTQEQP